MKYPPYLRDPLEDVKSRKLPAGPDLVRRIFRPREAVFKNGYKLVLNADDGSVDEFEHEGKQPNFRENKVVTDELINDLENFVGKEKFVLNQIR